VGWKRKVSKVIYGPGLLMQHGRSRAYVIH
jgi:hypothetical protein